MQGRIEREHTMMAMVTNGQRTAARPAPLLLDCEVDACELRVFWPAIRHEGPLLVQDMVGNQHTIYRPICVLAFYRIVENIYYLPTLSSPIQEKFDIVDRPHPQTSAGF